MHVVHRHLTGAVTATVLVVCACARLTGPAFARPSAAQRTTRCSLPHSQEGGFALPYFATNLTCAGGKPVVKAGLFCRPAGAFHSRGGCRSDGFACRDSHPQIAGEVNPGDIILCTQGRQTVKFEEPG
jgi:hypothetical protein